MVAILIHRICNDIVMKRHKEVNDYSMEDYHEASLSMRRSNEEEDVHMEERSAWSSPHQSQQPDRATEVEDSRDPQVASPALSVAASAPAMMTASKTTAPSTVMSAMSDLTYNKTSSFEQRDEQRSAFSPVQSGDIIVAPVSTTTKGAKQAKAKQAKAQPRLPSRDQASIPSPSTSQQDQSRQIVTTKSPPMPHRVVRRASQEHQEPLPFQSPSRYYQHPHHQEHTTPEDSKVARDAPDAVAAAVADPYQSYPGYPSYHHHPPTNTNPPTYDYQSGYYNPPPPPDSRDVSSPMSSSPYHHHAPYPGYHHHHQEYTSYPPGYTSHPTHHPNYSYYPSTTPSSHQQSHPHPAPVYSSEQYSQYYHHHHQSHHQSHHQHPPPPHHYYHPGATPPPSTSDHGILKETSSAVTESTKGGTTPGRGMNNSSGHGDSVREGLELSPPPRHSYEDDRKLPPASGDKLGGADGTTKEDNSPSKDFEPIPLNEIAAIPALSSATQPPSSSSSPPPYAASADDDTLPHDAYPHAFPRGTATPPSSSRYSSSAATVSAAAAITTSRQPPPIQIPHHHATPTTRRSRQQPQQRLIAPSSSGSTASSTGEGGSWERRYSELLEFKRLHNHCEVPQNYVENTSLGTWVNKQRMEQKNRIEGKNSSLNDSRLERLQRIGFRWAKRKGQASWDEKFNELVAYKARFGNCHVPTKYKDNTALGRWVSTQRAEYKKYQEGQAKTSMNTDKIRRLESIGFAWFMAL
eukprot:CAMPEP_0196141100 /NCGR_PEP_ID=MMETSP0910-20130528/8772_1 /TAXON_ID=49265 /ORGANISM="Thalassiosira rotula, Strain GSO102" /LENGTH=745 /DNA_ID=CAMNT_0041402137 /DNA_START=124 /DNA_END=2361 /DNA_ORIENTATION=-